MRAADLQVLVSTIAKCCKNVSNWRNDSSWHVACFVLDNSDTTTRFEILFLLLDTQVSINYLGAAAECYI